MASPALRREEAYILTLGLPANLAIKAGKMYTSFGRHNLLHEHQFPFVEAPMVHLNLFSDEGMNETGIETSWLLPVDWYSELIGGVYNGDNPILFNSEEDWGPGVSGAAAESAGHQRCDDAGAWRVSGLWKPDA